MRLRRSWGFLFIVLTGAVVCLIFLGAGTFSKKTDMPERRIFNSSNRPGAGLFQWNSLASNSEGSHLIGIGSDGRAYISKDLGQSWSSNSLGTDSAPFAGMRSSVAMSADGRRVIAADFGAVGTGEGGYLELSDDYGRTWNAVKSLGAQLWAEVVTSPSGKYALAISFGQGARLSNPTQDPIPEIYISRDFGKNWSPIDLSNLSLVRSSTANPVVSDTGKVAFIDDHGLRLSMDSGKTWTTTGILNEAKNATAIYFGEKKDQIFVSDATHLYRSDDFGRSWQVSTIPGSHDISAIIPGKLVGSIIAIDLGSSYWTQAKLTSATFFLSSDSGNTWSVLARSSSQVLFRSFIAANFGQRILASNDSDLFFSSDYGKSWTTVSKDLSRIWSGVSISADGGSIYATSHHGNNDDCCIDTSSDFFISHDFGSTWQGSGADNYTDNSQNNVDFGSGASLLGPGYGKVGVLYAYEVDNGPGLYRSLDQGRTWTKLSEVSGTLSPTSGENFATSLDGSVSIEIGGFPIQGSSVPSQLVKLTHDFGNHWLNVTPNNFGVEGNSTFLAVSNNGNALVILNGNTEYLSNDQGKHWSSRPAPSTSLPIIGITMSGNGKVIALNTMSEASYYGSGTSTHPPAGDVYESLDAGVSWHEYAVPASNTLSSLVMDSSGKFQVVIDTKSSPTGDGYLYYSKDFGRNWRPLRSAGVRNWTSLSISVDASRIVAAGSQNSQVDSGDHIFVSQNSGKTWSDATENGTLTWSHF